MIGHMIRQELRNVLTQRKIATLLTQVKVDARDEAFPASHQADRPVL
jgi:carbamate kinase